MWVASFHTEGLQGWAAILTCKDRSKAVSGCHRTNSAQRAELTALVNAIEMVKRPVELMVMIDNDIVAKYLEKGYKGTDADVIKLCKEIKHLVKKRNILLLIREIDESELLFQDAKRLAQEASQAGEALADIMITMPFPTSTLQCSLIRVDAWIGGVCSGDPGQGGWAVILKYGDTVKELSGDESKTTSKHMELTAILQAVAALKRPTKLTIHTNSDVVMDLLAKGQKQKDQDLMLLCRNIRALARQKHAVLTFTKVAGHLGAELNERAARLARSAIEH